MQSGDICPVADPPHGEELSTGAGESGPDGPGQLQIQDTGAPPSGGDAREVFPAGFESMLKLVKELDARNGMRCQRRTVLTVTFNSAASVQSLRVEDWM